MFYSNNADTDSEAQKYIKEQELRIGQLRSELKKEKLLQLKQTFVRDLTEFLKVENIEEAQYLGYLSNQIYFDKILFYLNSGLHFDICSKKQNIHYVITPKEFIDQKKLLSYAKRLSTNDFPAIEILGSIAHRFNYQYATIAQEYLDGSKTNFVFDTEIPFTQDLTHNMKMIMNAQEFELWNMLKEQYELEQNVPETIIKTVPKSKI